LANSTDFIWNDCTGSWPYCVRSLLQICHNIGCSKSLNLESLVTENMVSRFTLKVTFSLHTPLRLTGKRRYSVTHFNGYLTEVTGQFHKPGQPYRIGKGWTPEWSSYTVNVWARSQNCEKRLLASPYLSVSPHRITWLPLDWFSWNFIFENFSKVLATSGFNKNLTRITRTLHEDLHTFLTISSSFLLRIRNFSDKICRETLNTVFCSGNCFS
jgi:hypothetical protein